MLSTLFSLTKPIEEKINELEKEFAIPAGKEFGEELELMCNLSQAIEEKGIEKGKELGALDALKQVAITMYKNGADIAYIARSTQVSESQIKLWLDEEEV